MHLSWVTERSRRFSKTQQAVYSYFLVALLVHSSKPLSQPFSLYCVSNARRSVVLVVGMFAFAGADIAYTLLSFRFSLW